MFTTGQWIFAAIFAVIFIIVMLFSYRKDKNLHKKYYKGSLWILIGFIIFIILLLAVKTYIKG